MPEIIPKPYRVVSYLLDLSGLSTSNFYPVTFKWNAGVNRNKTYWSDEIFISSVGGGGELAYNSNVLHFEFYPQGWTDYGGKNTLIIYKYGVYDPNELTIGCVGRGSWGQAYPIVWLRGGIQYCCSSYGVPHIYTQDTVLETYQGNECKVTVGTGLSGGTNSNVAISFTPDGTSKVLWASA